MDIKAVPHNSRSQPDVRFISLVIRRVSPGRLKEKLPLALHIELSGAALK